MSSIKNKILLGMSLLLGAATSCTDTWDEHYEAVSNGEGTLWQTISSNPSLSNFKAVIEATGYKEALNSSQVFTVFAPTNTSFSEAQRDSVIELFNKQKAAGVKEEHNEAIKEFVQNHITLYNYSVSPQTNDTINMLNSKQLVLGASGFAGRTLVSKNVLAGNGVLFCIEGMADYVPNIYEALSKDEDLDSVANYIYSYSVDEFESEKSVPGEIIDGKIHYLDSVTTLKNEMLDKWFCANNGDDYIDGGALIDHEDSTYWMVVPTNAMWKQMLEENEKYYVYDSNVAERDSFFYNYPRFNIIKGTVFSATRNVNVMKKDSKSANDSLMSTNAASYQMRETINGSFDKKYYQYDDVYGTGGVLANTIDRKCSNGILKKATQWNFRKQDGMIREIVMEAESNNTIDSVNVRSSDNPSGNTASRKVNVTNDNPFYNKVSGHQYLELSASGTSNLSLNLLDVRNVLSNVAYDVYVVIAPAMSGDTLATDKQKLPTVFRTVLQCHNEEGNAYYIAPSADGKTPGDYTSYPVFKNNVESQGNTTYYTNTKVAIDRLTVNDTENVDSVFVGTYVFPTSSYATSEAQVKMLFDTRVSSSANDKTQNRILRIDCIVFKPHED